MMLILPKKNDTLELLLDSSVLLYKKNNSARIVKYFIGENEKIFLDLPKGLKFKIDNINLNYNLLYITIMEDFLIFKNGYRFIFNINDINNNINYKKI